VVQSAPAGFGDLNAVSCFSVTACTLSPRTPALFFLNHRTNARPLHAPAPNCFVCVCVCVCVCVPPTGVTVGAAGKIAKTADGGAAWSSVTPASSFAGVWHDVVWGSATACECLLTRQPEAPGSLRQPFFFLFFLFFPFSFFVPRRPCLPPPFPVSLELSPQSL
jgi:hypothetical protein